MNQETNPSDTIVNSLSSELQALKEIYLEEFQTKDEDDKTIVSVNLSPSTADLKDKQFVCLTLQLAVSRQQYPHEPPTVEISKPRGLSEETVARIIADLKKIADNRKGTNMLYHLIDSAKESLTSHNFPTDKSHYIKQSREESAEASGKEGDKSKENDSQSCPVCREDQDFPSLIKQEDYPPPSLSSKPIPEENVILEEARLKQESFASMFEKQQQQGGIINEEEEKNKFLLRTSNSNSPGTSASVSVSETSSSKTSSPVKSSKDNVISADKNVQKDDAALNGDGLVNGKETVDKEDDAEDINEEWSDAKPEINREEDSKEPMETPKEGTKEKSGNKADAVPSRPEESGSTKKDETEATSAATVESGTKEGKTEKDGNKENKSKKSKSNRRNSRRNRTRSSGRRASTGASDGVTKATNGDAVSQNGNRRNRSRRRNRTGSYDANSYEMGYRSQNYRPDNRDQPRARGGRGQNSVGYTSNGGLPSPPYKRNFGTGSYQDEAANYRSEAFNSDSYRDRDRPGFYAARVIRPSSGNANHNNKTRNGTRSEDSSKASISPQADSSEITQSTSEEQQSRPRSRSKNKRRNRQNRNRTGSRSQNGRYSESDYQNSNVQPRNDYSAPSKLNSRRGYYYNYNYRSQGSYGRNAYGDGYYNDLHPNYNYGYNYNLGYGNGYSGYNYYGRYNGDYNTNGNYYNRPRANHENRAPQRTNYRSNYKPRKRTDTVQSQSSAKSSNNNTTTNNGNSNPTTTNGSSTADNTPTPSHEVSAPEATEKSPTQVTEIVASKAAIEVVEINA